MAKYGCRQLRFRREYGADADGYLSVFIIFSLLKEQAKAPQMRLCMCAAKATSVK